MRRVVIAAVLLVCGALRPAAAAQAARERVAVLPMTGTNVSADTAAIVTRAFVDALAEEPGLEVITQADLASLLALEQQKQLLGCDEGPSCLAEIGGALGVRLLVSGNVARLADELLVTVQLLDVQKARALRRASARVGSQAKLIDAARDASERLDVLGRGTTPQRGLAVRFGFGAPTGVVGLGVEYRPGRVGVALGTGRYALGGAVTLALREGAGPYLDLQAVWLQGLVGAVTGPGVGFGATAGWDFRPVRWLSVKAGLGVAYNAALADGAKPRLLAFDLAAGPVF